MFGKKKKQNSLEKLFGFPVLTAHSIMERPLGRFSSWNDDELDHLDAKLDAMMEYLGVEFVEETVTDGSEFGSEERSFMRKKTKKK